MKNLKQIHKKKVYRLRLLRFKKRIPAPRVVELAKLRGEPGFDPSYIYHVESGRYVSRGLMVERAIAKALGTSWEKI